MATRRDAWIETLLRDDGLVRLAWSNFGVVVPGRLYRSNHPTPGRLALLARRHGIRTVINLRAGGGGAAGALSRAAATHLGLRQIAVPMTSGGAPDRAIVLDLIAALRDAEEPILAHCKSGADRAGFAAAIFLLLNGASARAAARALSVRFGHFRESRAGILDAFLDAYRDGGEGRITFDAWVRDAYDPAMLRHAGPTGVLARVVNDLLLRRE